jgi:hypothetical protein
LVLEVAAGSADRTNGAVTMTKSIKNFRLRIEYHRTAWRHGRKVLRV